MHTVVCGLGFVWNADVLSSCGCFLHPPCAAELIAGGNYKCRMCKDELLASSPVHLTREWIAQCNRELDKEQKNECSGFSDVLKVARSKEKQLG